MPASTQSHSHRSTTKIAHKPFKARKATKSALKELSKIQDLKGQRKSPHQLLMSKFDRRNQARQKLQTKHKEHLQETSIFSGRDGVPRIVAVVPLCEDGDAASAVRQLSSSLNLDIDVPGEGIIRTEVERFKQKIQYILLKRELLACMDACRVADFVVFILSPTQEVDGMGELIIRSVESQGLSTLVTVVQGLDSVEPLKRRVQVASSLKSYINHFHPDQEKVHDLDSRQECANLMRSLCTTTPKGVRWREDRSWMLVEDVQWPDDGSADVILTGVVRGKGLKADRLVQVGDWGDFQIRKITAAPSVSRKKNRNEDMTIGEAGVESVLDVPSGEQDDLAELALEEIIMDDIDTTISVATTERRGVLLDDHHYFSDDETHIPALPRRLPNGTSSYQASWFLGDDISGSGSDYDEVGEQDDIDMDEPALPQDGREGLAPPEPTEAVPTEYPQSEMFLDPAPNEESEELAAFRARKVNEAEEDREFPDEIELHPQVLARERLAKYRGLKSLRTSRWEEAEDRAYEPEEWRRLLQVRDYKSSRSQVAGEALIGGVKPGSRCGPRRLIANPIFSQASSTQNDVHKFERFLHPGGSAVASFIGPMTWGSVPALFFKRETNEPDAGATSSPFRLVAIGHPYKIHKKLVTIRYMFFNREDVEWFKALQLWTKRGRSGYIKESLGTHGYFKATFDSKINPQDSVGVSLYKRVWPRSARPWKVGDERGDAGETMELDPEDADVESGGVAT